MVCFVPCFFLKVHDNDGQGGEKEQQNPVVYLMALQVLCNRQHTEHNKGKGLRKDSKIAHEVTSKETLEETYKVKGILVWAMRMRLSVYLSVLLVWSCVCFYLSLCT